MKNKGGAKKGARRTSEGSDSPAAGGGNSRTRADSAAAGGRQAVAAARPNGRASGEVRELPQHNCSCVARCQLNTCPALPVEESWQYSIRMQGATGLKYMLLPSPVTCAPRIRRPTGHQGSTRGPAAVPVMFALMDLSVGADACSVFVSRAARLCSCCGSVPKVSHIVTTLLSPMM